MANVKVAVPRPYASIAYYGTYHKLIEYNYCHACTEKEKPLMRCSRCKLVYYCSKECQRSDFSKHKVCCKQIDTLLKRFEKAYANAKPYIAGIAPTAGNGLVNVQERDPRAVWDIPEVSEYFVTRLGLVKEIQCGIISRQETKELFEVLLHHFQEVLRLDVVDRTSVRNIFPVTLLCLNRYDDAFHFCRHWCKEDSTSRKELHLNSKENDWIYGHDPFCRDLDFFEECSPADPATMPLSMLMAVAIIKMRLRVAHHYELSCFEVFKDTSAAVKLQSVMPVLASMCVSKESLDRDHQLGDLFYQINQQDPLVLPASLDIDTFLEQNSHQISLSQTIYILRLYRVLWRDTAGAKENLKSWYSWTQTNA